MSMSVVLCTYNRGHLLDRSLRGYFNNISKLDIPIELIIIDDDSTDNTQELVELWAHKLKLDIKYIKLFKKYGEWRDASSLINLGIRAAKGELVIATHPEVIPGNETLQDMWSVYLDYKDDYIASKIYYLSIDNQTELDTVNWMENPLNVRELPHFYNNTSVELRNDGDYSHESTDKHITWESWVFGGMSKEKWRFMGGFNEYNNWGSADVAFLNRRRLLGIKTITLLNEETICIHQNHDILRTSTDVLTPRDMNAAINILNSFSENRTEKEENM